LKKYNGARFSERGIKISNLFEKRRKEDGGE
jgi:hypothetical protein